MALSGFQRLLSVAYDALPTSVRTSVGPVVEPAYFHTKRFLSILARLNVPVYRIQGKSRWSEETITTLLYGEGRGLLPYILNLVYAGKPEKKNIGKTFIGKAISHTHPDAPKPDLVLVGTDECFSRFLSRQGFMVMPEWVMFKLDITKPLPDGRSSRTLKDNLRKVRKYNYSYEITHDFTKLEYFYHHMYLPYARNRYGELSLVGGLRDLRKIFERGALLLVNRNNECIAGDLLQMQGNMISARYTGITDGKMEYLGQGALAACYYFAQIWAKEKGYTWVDYGHCRPFFDDGVFHHKKTWGMEIMKSTRPMLATKAVFGIKACTDNPGVLDFLAKNPCVSMDKGRLKGLIFTQEDHPLTIDEIQALEKKYYIPGIDGFVIASRQGFTQDAEEFASSQSPRGLHRSRENHIVSPSDHTSSGLSLTLTPHYS